MGWQEDTFGRAAEGGTGVISGHYIVNSRLIRIRQEGGRAAGSLPVGSAGGRPATLSWRGMGPRVDVFL